MWQLCKCLFVASIVMDGSGIRFLLEDSTSVIIADFRDVALPVLDVGDNLMFSTTHTWTLFASHYVISLERSFFQAGKPPGLRLDRTALLFTSLRPLLTWCGRIENTWLWSCRWSQGSRRATIAGRRKESIYSVESCCCSFFRLPSSLSCSRLSHNWHRRLTLLPRRRR